MAKERLSMRKVREVLRLKFDQNLSNRTISKSCQISKTTVADYVDRFCSSGLEWPLPESVCDERLETLLFKVETEPDRRKSMPEMAYVHNELKKKGVTLQRLWYEYKQNHPDGYQYSYFCDLYQKWSGRIDVSLRQQYKAGEKLFVDYAGQTVPIKNPETGEIVLAQIFIATFGASNYTYCEATLTQGLADWISSHTRAFEHFGGSPHILVPDNLKSGVTHPSRYEPDINPTYHEMAKHYGIAVIPARVRKPRDKAKVESAVRFVENRILAALRNHTFFSLSELNAVLVEKVRELNHLKFQKLDTTRHAMFHKTDKPALRPLPSKKYQYAEWKKARVNMDYHIEFEKSYYSVPYQLRKETVDIRYTNRIIEVFSKNKRVALHVRNMKPGSFSTLTAHMPKSHERYLKWTPQRIIQWAYKNGPKTGQLVMGIMESRRHQEQGFRACMGVMRLGKQYSCERLENACNRAIAIKSFSYKSVESILKQGLDKVPLHEDTEPTPPITHSNIRGETYYG
jgi:transposase